jgi:transposase InsO family protein
MKDVYAMAGISRQGHQQCLKRQAQVSLAHSTLLPEAIYLRKGHPRMGARKMHEVLKPEMGRDRFEAFLLENDLRVRPVRNYARTTFAHPSIRYPNLIHGLVLTEVDQLWVSDITYVPFEDRFFYVTLITDVYSRMIVGAVASRSLAAEANVLALQQAIKFRGGSIPAGLIHHSDRGSQYVYEQYVDLLNKHSARISMGNKAWENAHAERVNGIVKNEYLLPLGIKSFEHLASSLRRDVKKINQLRPNGQLPGHRTPYAFETLSLTHPEKIGYKVKINY